MSLQENVQEVKITVNDLIYGQLKELDKRMDRLENRMDKLEGRMDKLDEKLDVTRREISGRMDKIDEKIEKLADKIDNMRRDVNSSGNHGQIATVSTIGIALAVLYSLLR